MPEAENSESISRGAEQNEAAGLLYKDAVLDQLSLVGNVAQFVSFSPGCEQRYAWVRGFEPNHRFDRVEEAIRALLESTPDGSVNIRSFTPDNPKSREFIYGLRTVEEAVAGVRRLAGEGLYTIANETVDINDGGVSGVAFGDVIELAPGDTPRCVEKPGTVSFKRELGLRLLEKVYRFEPSLRSYAPTARVEFSLHPLRRGFRHDHTIVWELEEVGPSHVTADTRWPNRFSRFIGDKAFGLLIADALGLPVPATLVLTRWLPPFSFGTATGSGETWIRTCPVEQDPGHFTTARGWRDPFKLLHEEDPEGKALASVLSQEGVDADYSGSLVVEADGQPRIEGARGYGDKFMVGLAGVETLPLEVTEAVRRLYEQAQSKLGPIRMEWVHDRNARTWVVQLHRGITSTQGSIIHKGEASFYHRFEVARGIEELRALIKSVRGTGEGIILVGNVGVTSHLGDLLRKAEIPSYIEQPEQNT